MATRQLELLVRERLRSGPISTQEAHHFFDELLAARNPPPSICTFNLLLGALVRTKTSSNPYPIVFSLFNRLTTAKGVAPSEHTFGILINCCAQANQVSVAFAVLGRFLREGHRANARIFNPILQGLCWENRTGQAASMVIDKTPKLGCAPNVVSYSILIKGLYSKGKIGLALQLLLKMIKHGGDCEPNVITYNTIIDGFCKVDKLD
jgi:pentatricopeptide repeat protein